MKTKRVKMQTGDVFAAPFDTDHARYSQEWRGLWEPQNGEKCFISQNIGMQKNGTILIALYDGVYSYNSDLKSFNIDKEKVLAIVEVIPNRIKIGSFEKLSNQLIPEETPYMIYGYEHRNKHYIKYKTDMGKEAKEISRSLAKHIPRYGFSVTGQYMIWFANFFIRGIKSEYLEESDIENVRINEKAKTSNFFSNSKSNPNVAIKLHFGIDSILQDRENY